MYPVFFCADFWDGGCLTRSADWGADLDAAADKIRQEISFFVCFGVGGRTFFQILEILFYFEARVSLIWSRW